MGKILTVTMNPSIDIAYRMDKLYHGTTNRVDDIRKTPGGKGLNVTRVLAQLGDEVIATGLTGGKYGEFICDKLEANGINTNMYIISGETRNCVAILHDEGIQTEILECGPEISDYESIGFLEHYKTILKKVDVITISGSLPKGMKADYYVDLIKLANESEIKVVLDTSGKYLSAVLSSQSKPYAVKPNCEELTDILGFEVTNDINLLKEAVNSKKFEGIEWIFVSLGKDGCFAKHGDSYFKVNIPVVKAVNPVGSGDSTVAGIASALLHDEDDVALLKKANTLGILNAMEKFTGFVNMKNYDKIYNLIVVDTV